MIDFTTDARGRELRLLIERAKYERWLGQQVDALIDREFSRVVDIILSPRFRSLTQFQRQRLLDLYRALDARIAASYGDLTTLHLDQMRGYAQLEADVARAKAVTTLGTAAGDLGLSLGVALPRSYLAAIAKLPIQGLRIGEWFDAQAATMTREVRRILQQGLVEGKGTDTIARRIMADARTGGPVLSRRAKNEAKLISRTTVNAVQNDATRASYAQLPPSVSDSYRIVAVHDARTSAICRALDGRIYKFDDPDAQYPPFHIQCRTTTIAIIKGAEVGVGEQKTGQLSMRTYGDWLKTQTATAQNEILGPARAELWRSGKMTLADAIDGDNRVLTLGQLREKLGL